MKLQHLEDPIVLTARFSEVLEALDCEDIYALIDGEYVSSVSNEEVFLSQDTDPYLAIFLSFEDAAKDAQHWTIRVNGENVGKMDAFEVDFLIANYTACDHDVFLDHMAYLKMKFKG